MRTLTLSVLAAAGLTAVVASPDTARADTIPFATLPVAKPFTRSDPPRAPDRITAGEHADGVFPALAPEAQRKPTDERGYHYVQVFASEHDAQVYATTGNTPPTASSPESRSTRTCLTSGGTLSPHLSFYYTFRPIKPSAAVIAQLKQQHRWPLPPIKPSKEPPKDRIETVHVERLIQNGDAATLETTEAFLDLETLGSRLISKSSTKVVKVASGPNGLGVFAAREEKGATSQFLVTNPELPPTPDEADRQAQVQQLESVADRLLAEMPTGVSSETGCGYLRFTLAAKPGAGQMATVLATAFLPPGSDPDDGGASDTSRFESQDMTEDQLKMIREMLHRQNRSQRARTVAVNLSFSQMETEPAPLLSVTFGWAGHDQQLHF